MRRGRKLLRAEISHCFAPEIDASGELGPQLLCGLDVVASSNTWDVLRSHQGLDLDEATERVRTISLTLFRAWTPAEALDTLSLESGGPT